MPSDQVKAKRGRKRQGKFERIDTGNLIADIAGGIPVKIACANAGIHRDTFYERLNTDPSFAQALAAEQRRVIQERLDAMRSTTREKDWRAHAWFLERIYRDDFGPPAIPAVGAQSLTVKISAEHDAEIEARSVELKKTAALLLNRNETKENSHIKAEASKPRAAQ